MKTLDEIYREMQEVFTEETGMELDGTSEAAVRMYALAAQVYGLYVEADWSLKQCFPQTATGDYLEKHAFLRGLSRNGAVKAEGTIRFTLRAASATATVIPVGTICLTAGLVEFETVQAGTIAAGAVYADVPAKAVVAGTGGNVAAGTIRSMAVAPTGVAACSNFAAFSGGAGEEEDESLRERVLATYQNLPNGTNAAYYAQLVEAMDGVAAVKVRPRIRGSGTVDVVVAAPGGVPSQALLTQIQNVLTAQREIAVSVQVLAPTTVSITVVVKVKAETGLLPATVQDRVEEAIIAWFDGKRLGKSVLMADLGRIIYGTEGVANYQILSPNADYAIAENELPVLGTVLVEELQ